MPPSMKIGEIDRLGRRLCEEVVSAEDLDMLAQLQDEHLEALEEVDRRLKALGLTSGDHFEKRVLTVTNRLKRDRRIIEKLARPNEQYGPTRLSRMQDIVGFRLVGQFTLGQQDRLAARIQHEFDGKPRDRRAEPSFGYRALHVIAKVDGYSIEIQVRTNLQDFWAQRTEALSRRWGREIQYGAPPDGADERTIRARVLALEEINHLSEAIGKYEDTLKFVMAAFEGGSPQVDPAAPTEEWQRQADQLDALGRALLDSVKRADSLVEAADEQSP